MFETMIIVSMEAFIMAFESGRAVMMLMEKMLQGERVIQTEADLMQVKFAALREAFAEALSTATHAHVGCDLREIIRANYERILPDRTGGRGSMGRNATRASLDSKHHKD
jgi:hypothetical protein